MKHNFLVLDLETSGLVGSEILEVCSYEMDKNGVTETGWHCYVLPTKPVHPEAAKVNGYSVDRWYKLGAVTQEHMAKRFNEIYAGKYLQLLGWNPGFDLSFIQPLVKDFKLAYHPVDMYSMVFPFLSDTNSIDPKRKYVALEEAYFQLIGGDKLEAHTATGDVNMCIELYRRIRESTL